MAGVASGRVWRLNSGQPVMDGISYSELQAASRNENPDVTSCYLYFYKQIFAPWQILSDDLVATNLIYNQVVGRVKSGQLGYDKDDDLVKMTAEQNVNDPKVKEDIVSYARNKLTTSFSLFWDVNKVAGPGLQKDTALIAVNSTGVYVVDRKTDVNKWNGEYFIKFSFPKILSILSNRTDDMPWWKVIVTIQTVKGDQYTFTADSIQAEEIKYIVAAIQTPPSKQDHSQAGPTDSDDVNNAGMSRMKITAGDVMQDYKIPGKLSRNKMPDRHFGILQQRHSFLLEQLSVKPMTDILFAKKVLNEDDLDQITTVNRAQGRVPSLEVLLSILRRSGDQAFPTFLQVLEMDEVGLGFVANDLRKCEQQLARTVPTNWQKGELIGFGAFGEVYKCYDKATGHDYAVKMVKLGFLNEKMSKEVQALENEIMLLRDLQHERIVQYFGSQNDGKVLSIFIEYMTGGSVKDLINKTGALQESVVKKYSRQVLLGLAYLHNKIIIHRDIKAANVLRDTQGNVKLSDFGASKQLQTIRSSTGTSVGTPHWMAPEVVEEEHYSCKADIWSLGCTVVEMLTSEPPFHKYGPTAVVLQIAKCKHPNYELPQSVSNLAKEFLLHTFQRTPADRWSAVNLLMHEFVQDES